MQCPVGTDVSLAAEILRRGGLVAFATETVYGLGANALDAAALARVFEVKRRPRFDPIIAHIADTDQLPLLASDIPKTAHRLIARFWPGPLTLVLPKTEVVPDLLTAGLPSVAVRVPDHPLALELLRAVDFPVAAPSANLFGMISPTTAAHVAEQLGASIDYILDGGPCQVGLESTVLHVTETSATLLRAGGLPVEDIEAAIGPVRIETTSSQTTGESQPAPGMLPRHYAPRTPLVVVDDVWLADVGKRFALLTLRPIGGGEKWAKWFAAIEVLSPTGDLREAAMNFFAALRRLDAMGLDAIVATPFPEAGLGRALNDRLRRATHR